LLCICGEQETDSLYPKLQGNNFKKVALAGFHHFGGNYPAIARHILEELK
jgi:type IV secretory pathway VirJ component